MLVGRIKSPFISFPCMIQNSPNNRMFAIRIPTVVCYSNGKKLDNQMAFDYQTFYHGRKLNGPGHSICNHLNPEQVNVCYSDPNFIDKM